MTRLFGRSAQAAVLAEALQSAGAGHGRLVLVSGPAGIGKTALAEHAVSVARAAGMAVARGHALDDAGAPPLWPWQRALRGLPVDASSFEVDGHESAARFRFFAAVADRLHEAAEPAGLLLVLEDLHWADGASLRLLAHIAAEIGEHRLAVIATHRDVDGGVLHTLPGRPDVRSVVPPPLSEGEVGAWFATRSLDVSVAHAVHRRSDGNPLYVRLLADHVGAGGDLADVVRARPDLRRLVTARLGGLDRSTRAVLDAAAILGERIHRGALGHMCDLDQDELDDLLRRAALAGVVSQTEADTAFGHALLRDALVAEIEQRPGRAADLHRSAALALAEFGAPAGPIVTHWQRAGLDAVAREQVCRWAQRAADEALRSLAHDDAARFAAIAVEAAPADDAELARLLVGQATALVRAARMDDAVACCERAAALADRARRPDLLADAALAVVGAGLGVQGDLVPMAERALALVASDDHTTRARLLAQLAVTSAENDDVARAAELAASALAHAASAGDPGALLEALAARHLSIVGPGTVLERLQLGRRAIALGSGNHIADAPPIAALWGHLWRGTAAYQLGNVAEAEREVDEIDRIARQRRSPLARWHHHRFRALGASLTGDLAMARSENVAALRLGEQVGDLSLSGLSFSFAVALGLLRGDPTELLPGWEEAMAHAPPIPIVALTGPLAQCLVGRLDDARAEFARFRHLPSTMPRNVRWAGTMALVGHVAIQIADKQVCAEVHELFAPLADYYAGDGSGAMWSHGANAGFAAELALVADRPDTALPLYRNAVSMDDRIGARPWSALARLGWARSLLALGNAHDEVTGTTADELLRSAVAEFRRLDMPGPLATALACAGDAAEPPPLSPREREVADLVAASLSNRQIAAQLFVSERTVESHVRNILTRIGASRRTEIVAWVVGRARASDR